jgi:hypothetical protein
VSGINKEKGQSEKSGRPFFYRVAGAPPLPRSLRQGWGFHRPTPVFGLWNFNIRDDVGIATLFVTRIHRRHGVA